MVKVKKKIKILIIGGTGFIGKNLSQKCLNLGWNVSALHLKKYNKKNLLSKVKYIRGDISKISDLKKIKTNFDFVVNCGGYVDHINKDKVFKYQNTGCKNLTKIFSKKKIKLFLQIGSGAEYGKSKSPHHERIICNPRSNYGKAKFLATQHLIEKYKEENFPCTILRLYQVFGKGQDKNRIIPFVINSCLKGSSFPCSNGRQYRDFLDIDQVTTAIIKTLKAKNVSGEIINIGSGKLINIKKLIVMINKIIKNGNPEFGKIKIRNEENLKTFPNILKASKIIKWKPKNSFKKDLISTIKFYKKNK